MKHGSYRADAGAVRPTAAPLTGIGFALRSLNLRCMSVAHLLRGMAEEWSVCCRSLPVEWMWQ